MKFLLALLCLPALLLAEESPLDKLVQRQAAFGRTIPQEKVFIHMDNTSYQLGDTIWFSAYLRRTDTDKPSDVSGVLYVELYGHDGYMMERKLIQMKEGRGSGFFALNKNIQYAGFYELRAYTRWQLNWGRFEHKHLNSISTFFDSKLQEKEYYRDYEKLYSRVFPVYDKPYEPGDFSRDMTLRALRRSYPKNTENRELKLSLYPEGGNLVAGQPCRVAFEAAFDDGEWPEGWLVYNGDSIKALHRGRGVFEVIPEDGKDEDVFFTTKDGNIVKARLPKPDKMGVSLRLCQDGVNCHVSLYNTDNMPADSLGVSLMHEGKLVDWHKFVELESGDKGRLYDINSSLLTKAGVYQITVFDTQGRVFADRLFFSRGRGMLQPTLSIEGLKEEYQPYEPVNLRIKAEPSTSLKDGQEGGFSLSVRDDLNRDCLYDDGNIFTEMLLASEIRGFVPQPGWYFEQDDSLHRAALDLLMLTQGWRRFDWRNMAVRGLWDLTQPAEKTPILIGRTFKNIFPFDVGFDMEELKLQRDLEDVGNNFDGIPKAMSTHETKPIDMAEFENQMRSDGSKMKSREKREYKKAVRKQAEINSDRQRLKVHAEFVAIDTGVSLVGESQPDRGAFRIQLPSFYGPSILFISVADTTKWKEGESYAWIQAEHDNEFTDFMFLPKSARLRRKIFVEPADYLARICWHYPRFVTPYSFYQNHLAPLPKENKQTDRWITINDETLMQEVTVKGKRKGLRKFDDTWPVLALDAYDAQNMEKDYGLGFSQIMVGDYGVGAPNSDDDNIKSEKTFKVRYGYGRTRRMLMDKQIPADSIWARKYLISFSVGGEGGFELSPAEKLEYAGTGVWDTYVLYSDYSPRMEGSKMYYGANEPTTTLVMYPYFDASRRLTYRDRRYHIEGFAYPAQFYSPDYSMQTPSEDKKDYRRTLYWNPNLKLNEQGEAQVTFYNNCRSTVLSVDAQGQASNGMLLWTK